MVQLLLEKLGDRQRAAGRQEEAVELLHVDCRLSESIDAIGHSSFRKIGLVLKYCFQAIRHRFRHGVRHFYYIPAPGLRAAVYRDWIVMALCRPFFAYRIYHWQAAGLGDWLEQKAHPFERWISRLLLTKPDLSIVLGEYNRRDAEQLRSRQTAVIPNAIPDPCPGFPTELLAARTARAEVRRTLLQGATPSASTLAAAGPSPGVFQVLYIGLCLREKGLFDALEAVAQAHALAPQAAVRIQLTVAGTFWLDSERREFEERIRRPDLQRDGQPLVEYRGFVSGAAKQELFRSSDCLCFPTYYQAESFGIVIIEALAHGMFVVTSKWRAVPELPPAECRCLVDPRAPDQIAAHLRELAGRAYEPALRTRFLALYTADKFAEDVRDALLALPR